MEETQQMSKNLRKLRENWLNWRKEKARWEQYKNVMRCLKQILEATPHKTATQLPFNDHLRNHPNTTNKTCKEMLEKQRRTH